MRYQRPQGMGQETCHETQLEDNGYLIMSSWKAESTDHYPLSGLLEVRQAIGQSSSDSASASVVQRAFWHTSNVSIPIQAYPA